MFFLPSPFIFLTKYLEEILKVCTFAVFYFTITLKHYEAPKIETRINSGIGDSTGHRSRSNGHFIG